MLRIPVVVSAWRKAHGQSPKPTTKPTAKPAKPTTHQHHTHKKHAHTKRHPLPLLTHSTTPSSAAGSTPT